MSDGLKIDPDSVSIDELRQLAWRVIGPSYQDRLTRLVEEFEQSKPRGLVGDHLGQIAFDAVSGRVLTLLVEADRQIPMILSGAGIRAGAALEICELIDIAPTLSVLLGGEIPEQNQGRILWEVLDTARAPKVDAYVDSLLQRERALDDLKLLKREHASGSMYREEYQDQRAEIMLNARLNLRVMEEERRTLERASEDEGV